MSKTLLDKPEPRRRFVLRTIRDSSVRIRGKVFKPDASFPEHYNGTRAAFGLYYIGPDWNSDFVYLWGTAEEYNRQEGSIGFFVDEDGRLKWEWWNRVGQA